MSRYRIIKEESGTSTVYKVQVKSLFWWCTCEHDYRPIDAVFNTLEAAKEFMEKKKKIDMPVKKTIVLTD